MRYNISEKRWYWILPFIYIFIHTLALPVQKDFFRQNEFDFKGEYKKLFTKRFTDIA